MSEYFISFVEWRDGLSTRFKNHKSQSVWQYNVIKIALTQVDGLHHNHRFVFHCLCLGKDVGFWVLVQIRVRSVFFSHAAAQYRRKKKIQLPPYNIRQLDKRGRGGGWGNACSDAAGAEWVTSAPTLYLCYRAKRATHNHTWTLLDRRRQQQEDELDTFFLNPPCWRLPRRTRAELRFKNPQTEP